ncbi:MAG TPA: LytTR family DNA-binding domain-containing protein [Bacteroidales bacterium]|nr:MAG: Sensory transduction protein LytR [Bacteroidetes bacterium ADurb.Bin139]HOG25254.1 LytTR family DNA-binding domain-containing protein [Bacteroidales bacterium]HOR11912.1 LytTR family DNA-binding domain-containing protein [Bacteroidales bacterium]HPB78192.1 LytTR family DNA-binding domain-containing protein [Bacteroidales bacterium]HPK39013.1 LytTR family DNA-binding domain-containing protein [Bacteroidales bacterium]
MKVLILEDEVPAQMQLKRLFSVYYPDAVIAAVLDSVDKAVRWLALNSADLIMMDVELSDGICFELFNRVTAMPPVIIVTAYEHYALAALKKSAVDYLLKPVGDTEFVEAVEKCINPPATPRDLWSLGKLVNQSQEFKQRFVIKVGDQIFVIKTQDIAYFFSEEKSTYIMTREGKPYLSDSSLESIEEQIDPKEFFKLARNCIVSITAINSISKFFNSRLRIELLPPYKQPIIVSRQRVPAFMRWIEGEAE